MKKYLSRARGILSDSNRIILFTGTFIIICLVLMTVLISKKYNLKVGDIPRANIKANREIVDQIQTEARRKDAIEKVDKQYTLKTDIQKDAESTVTNFFIELNNLAKVNESSASKINSLTNYKEFNLTNSQYEAIFDLDKNQLESLQKMVTQSLNAAYSNPIGDNKNSTDNPSNIKYDTLADARQRAMDTIVDNTFNKTLQEIIYKIDLALIKPNFFYDKEKTEEEINAVLKNLAPTVIKKGQIVANEGEPVTKQQLEILGELGLLNTSKTDFYIYIAIAGLVALVLVIQYGYIRKYHRKIFDDFSKLVLISIINVMSILIARITSMFSPFLIPFVTAPMLLTLLTNYKLSLVISTLNVILIAGATNFNSTIIVIAIISSVLGAIILKRMQQRNDILVAAIIPAIVTSAISLAIGTIVTNNFMEIIINAGYILLGGVLSGVLAVGILPFFEATFNIVTTVKLLELSNPNNPLLKKLLIEAPGTYHHSVLVANLAELAAEEIGANSLLVRIGAYYHDIGKTKRPYFFKENQIGNENPHDKISDKLSAKIIISHVKDGMDMAREHNIPNDIQRFIVTHHGDTLVKYFYLNTKNNSDDPDSVKEEDFKYPGPTPRSKEEGILMLSDSCEAAVRSIKGHTPEKIENMINNIIKDKLDSGQLNDCELTLKDIEDIRKCFLKALNGIYHQRIEYPKEEK